MLVAVMRVTPMMVIMMLLMLIMLKVVVVVTTVTMMVVMTKVTMTRCISKSSIPASLSLSILTSASFNQSQTCVNSGPDIYGPLWGGDSHHSTAHTTNTRTHSTAHTQHTHSTVHTAHLHSTLTHTFTHLHTHSHPHTHIHHARSL